MELEKMKWYYSVLIYIGILFVIVLDCWIVKKLWQETEADEAKLRQSCTSQTCKGR